MMMNLDGLAQTLRRIAYTLGTVDVCGEENLDKMLGCIRAAKKAAEDVERLTGGADGEGVGT